MQYSLSLTLIKRRTIQSNGIPQYLYIYICIDIYVYVLIASEIMNNKWGTFFTIMKNMLKMHFTLVV